MNERSFINNIATNLLIRFINFVAKKKTGIWLIYSARLGVDARDTFSRYGLSRVVRLLNYGTGKAPLRRQ